VETSPRRLNYPVHRPTLMALRVGHSILAAALRLLDPCGSNPLPRSCPPPNRNFWIRTCWGGS